SCPSRSTLGDCRCERNDRTWSQIAVARPTAHGHDAWQAFAHLREAKMKMPFLCGLAVLSWVVTALASNGSAQAQAYPSKPVRLVVPYAAGGPGDAIVRIVAQHLTEQVGSSFYVETLPGAGGTIGAGTAARAAPDGYTLLMVNQDFIIQPLVKA